MALNDDAGQELDGPGRSVLFVPQAAPLGRVPGPYLQRGVIPVLPRTLSFDGQRNGMLAKVTEVVVVYGLPWPFLTEVFDYALLRGTLAGTNKDAKVDHLGGCLLRPKAL